MGVFQGHNTAPCRRLTAEITDVHRRHRTQYCLNTLILKAQQKVQIDEVFSHGLRSPHSGGLSSCDLDILLLANMMRPLLSLLLFERAVIALPKERPHNARRIESPPLSNFYNAVVEGRTLVAIEQPTELPVQRRQANACNAPDGPIVQLCEDITVVNANGQTVVSGFGGAVTLPTGLTEAFTTTVPSGDSTTIDPTQLLIHTSDTAGDVVVSNAESAVTFSTVVTTPIETVLPNGESTTFMPVLTGKGTADTDSAQETIVTDSEHGTLTIPAVTTPVTTEFPDGQSTTFFPEEVLSQSSSAPSLTTTSSEPFIIAVTTPVESPEPTDGGWIVPCDFFWFFNSCPSSDDISIGGWAIGPPGIMPP